MTFVIIYVKYKVLNLSIINNKNNIISIKLFLY